MSGGDTAAAASRGLFGRPLVVEQQWARTGHGVAVFAVPLFAGGSGGGGDGGGLRSTVPGDDGLLLHQYTSPRASICVMLNCTTLSCMYSCSEFAGTET